MEAKDDPCLRGMTSQRETFDTDLSMNRFLSVDKPLNQKERVGYIYVDMYNYGAHGTFCSVLLLLCDVPYVSLFDLGL